MVRSCMAKRTRKGPYHTALLAVAALALMGGMAQGQTAPLPVDDPRVRLERLETELKELKAIVQAPAPAAFTGTSEQRPAEKIATAPGTKKPEEEKKKPESFV